MNMSFSSASPLDDLRQARMQGGVSLSRDARNNCSMGNGAPLRRAASGRNAEPGIVRASLAQFGSSPQRTAVGFMVGFLPRTVEVRARVAEAQRQRWARYMTERFDSDDAAAFTRVSGSPQEPDGVNSPLASKACPTDIATLRFRVVSSIIQVSPDSSYFGR
jgi:hypothetical protein